MERNQKDVLELYQQVTESVKNNLHLINVCNPEQVEIESLVRFNSRIVLSDCKAFLEAIRNEIGGEIIDDSQIGSFLYYGDRIN